MSPDNTGRLYLERQVTLARAVIAALSLLALLETSSAPVRRTSIVFLSAYLVLALAAVLVERFLGEARFRIPLTVDFVVLAVFVYLAPSVSAFWFLFLFAVFALATRGNTRAMLVLVGVATVGIIARVAVEQPFQWQSVWHWIAVGLGTLVSGLGMGFLGAREREHLARQQFLERITGLVQFHRGLAESIRQALGELALAFECEQTCLAIRDEDLERVFVWKVRPGDTVPRAAETQSQSRSDTFLFECLEISMAWDFENGGGAGFGWDRRTGGRFRDVPPPPASTRDELGARSLLAVTIESGGRPTGRVLLINPDPSRRRFSAGDLRWLEQIVRHIGPPLENVFLLRGLRARAVESERSRISRDLHDGILQTLLSLKIQLEVLRRKLPQKPEQACAELASLQKTVQQESDELRRMVTDLRPLRVESADMRELMFGFAERFRSEHGLAVDLFIDDRDLRLPDRICRELFQIYRESLHNVKKHARASHVVVKLEQDEAKVVLFVDDNGQGFSFAGRYSSEELDQLRLGPISIKERTRGVGGTLTVESNPGHGARLTVEIPLN
ncbi:MAG TPA: GAF domain-containing sensor histidine kinase [Candidatus Acidoferrales bacterium]|nr:GAF domain-containing sensor histidine kinase [Candidatus Acidoferrales bacterium]